ncbi:hypothetical protein EH227_00900 [Rouxiella chamberiensis]|nr:hypothetical protein EH227_00900 [Rouxiella chamberiensis]
MQGVDFAFKEACRMIGECYLVLAEGDEGVSRCRVASWLERVQEEGVNSNGRPNDALQLAIEHLKDS